MIDRRSLRSASLLVSVLAVALIAIAPAEADRPRRARPGDVASKYVLERGGDLFRFVNGRKCQVTNNVLDFKISQHPSDLAVVYYVRQDGGKANLYVLHNAGRGGDCPKADKLQIMADVARSGSKYRYSVVSSTDTSAVSMALSRRGEFRVWSRDDTLIVERKIRDYRLHQQYGRPGAPFSRYVGFALDRAGRVLKIDGRRPDTSSYDPARRYRQLDEFFRTNRLAKN
jgi:hypothetical protein